MTSIHVACIQINSQDDLDDNFQQTADLIRAAAAKGAKLIQTPECTDAMTSSTLRKYELATPENVAALVQRYQDLAQKLGVWIVLGSIAVRADGEERLWNRCHVINDTGALVQTYDKIHLFDADLGADENYHESKYYNAGSQVKTVDLDGGRMGLAICYDVRFSKLFRTLAHNGAKILSIPAAFAVPTGVAHWEILLRARAIETGSFVLAAGQTGKHPGGRSTYGHSMIINPWGEIISALDQKIGFVDAVIDLDRVDQCRKSLPSLSHDREFIVNI